MASLQNCRACLQALPQRLGPRLGQQLRRSSTATTKTTTTKPRQPPPSTAKPAAAPSPAPFQQRKPETSTPPPDYTQQGPTTLVEKLAEALPGGTQRTYAVYGSVNKAYKALSARSAYSISPALREKDAVPRTADGEDIGEGATVWHTELGLLPTFSTWAQVTMVHMYLAVVRFRCLDKRTFDAHQKHLVDAFFHEAEERMDVHHGIGSRALRQRHLKDLFVSWRGLMLAYDEGLVRGDPVLAAAVWRNLYKADPDVDLRRLAAVVGWMRATIRRLDQMSDADVFARLPLAFATDIRAELSYVDVPCKELVGALPKRDAQVQGRSAGGQPTAAAAA